MDTAALLVGVITGAIGMGYLVYGKRQQQLVPFVAGLVLCVYPYFIEGLGLTIVLGSVLMALPFVWKR